MLCHLQYGTGCAASDRKVWKQDRVCVCVWYRDFSVLLVTEGWVVVRVCTVQGVLLVTEGWVVVRVYRVVYIH